MIALKNILVATDFSAASDAALTYGRALAHRFGAHLQLLHVIDNAFLRPTVADPHALTAATQRQLNDRLTREDRDALDARTIIETSDYPADVITEHAKDASIDLILMGTHGRSAMSRLLVGSVAERVVRTAPCPVLTVRQPEHEFVVPGSESEAAMIALTKVLVATDFSEPSGTALEYGKQFARTFGAQLIVLHVVENTLARSFGPEGFVISDPDLQGTIERTAQRHLDELLTDEDRSMLRAETSVVVSNTTAAAVADYARTSGIDLVIMGTHGRGAVAHLLMGSVAERVVRTAPCPVLTVRHPEHEFVVPDALVAVAKA